MHLLITIEEFDKISHLGLDGEYETEAEAESEAESETEAEAESEAESETEDEAESEAESETEDESDEQYVSIELDDSLIDNIPIGIFTKKRWDALTIKVGNLRERVRIYPSRIYLDEVPECQSRSIIRQTRLDSVLCTLDYDSHWDCYCKYRDVCGCGCDPLHNGW